MRSLRSVFIVLIVFDIIKFSQAASEAQLESWCNSVNEYWVSHEDWLENPLPIYHEEVCRTDLYEKWIRDCERSIISSTQERCKSKLVALVQGKYGPPREQHIKRVMCGEDCTKYQHVMEEALGRTCCENNCTHAHPLRTDKACYENMFEMTNEILGVSKTRLEWVVMCSSSIRLRPNNYLVVVVMVFISSFLLR